MKLTESYFVPVSEIADSDRVTIYNIVKEQLEKTGEMPAQIVLEYNSHDIRQQSITDPESIPASIVEEFDLFKTARIELIYELNPDDLSITSCKVQRYAM